MPVIKEKIMEVTNDVIFNTNLFQNEKVKLTYKGYIFSLPIPSGYLQLTARIKFAEENTILPVGLDHGIKNRRR